MKLYLRITLFLVTLIVMTSCRKDDENQYFTFGQVGNEWIYERTIPGWSYEDTIVDTISFKITEDLGNNVLKVKKDNYYSYWYLTLTAFGSYNPSNNSHRIFATQNSEIGDSYSNGHYIKFTEEEIDVLGESLPCFKVQLLHGLEPATNNLWIHKDYGIVKMYDSDYSVGNTGVYSKLISVNF